MSEGECILRQGNLEPGTDERARARGERQEKRPGRERRKRWQKTGAHGEGDEGCGKGRRQMKTGHKLETKGGDSGAHVIHCCAVWFFKGRLSLELRRERQAEKQLLQRNGIKIKLHPRKRRCWQHSCQSAPPGDFCHQCDQVMVNSVWGVGTQGMWENPGASKNIVRIRIMGSRLEEEERVTGGSQWTGKPRGVRDL